MDNEKQLTTTPKAAKTGFRHTIAQKIDNALNELKKELDPKKYDKRLKKASRLLSEIQVKEKAPVKEQAPAKTKTPILKKTKAKTGTKKTVKKPAKKVKVTTVPAAATAE